MSWRSTQASKSRSATAAGSPAGSRPSSRARRRSPSSSSTPTPAYSFRRSFHFLRGHGAVKLILCSPKGTSGPRRSPPAHAADDVLGQVHHRVVVAVRLVDLHHREFGVVARADALVAEVAVDLEHPLHAADEQPLEVEFRRDAQVEVHVERVVVRDERPGRGAAGDRLHHRRLDLEESALVEEPADARR